jgi:hypothetical protein
VRPTLGTDLRNEPHLGSPLDWRTVDRALRAIRGRRAALDAEEARWLRIAEDLQIWRPLGMVSALDYLERVLGYAPRTAQDRLRVARALGALPGLSSALASDDLSYSAVRELTRVAMPGTEVSWIAAAKGKNLRQIEDMVADHKPGDRPDDPPDPEARMRVVRFELSPETFALFRQARSVLELLVHDRGLRQRRQHAIEQTFSASRWCCAVDSDLEPTIALRARSGLRNKSKTTIGDPARSAGL